jgi:hypothetical protein
MNIFTDVLFLFVYIATLLYLEIPDIKNKNYPIHKLYLFIGVFVYFYVIELVKNIKNNKKIDPYEIMLDSLWNGLICVLGYSMYVDFLYWDQTKGWFNFSINTYTPQYKIYVTYVIVSLIIVLVITTLKLGKMLFKVIQD